uniref:Uncharacterized protein n=1 Tax=Tanacetum cinerariifolium TaxID=118510 RepID=A0A6L2KNE8_TANCI|nr:hypothetical protein [Tanacetum cinerariifolium]
MAESSSHKSPSPKIKEEPVTLDKPESPNPCLPATQVDFTFDEIAFTTNNEVSLIYPSHLNQKYFIVVSDFISKCCLKEAFTRAPTQYKENLSEFCYTAKTLDNSKVWGFTPTGEVRGEIVKLEDLADILKDTRSTFFTPDSPTDELIIVSDAHLLQSQKKELEQAKVIAKAEVASMKANPSYPNINQLTKLLVTSMKPEVAELKNIQWELPVEFLDLPHLASSVQFATLVENASGATTTGVPSADKATALPAEGEKDDDTNLKNELVDLLGIDIVTLYYNKKLLYERYCEKMKKRRQSSKIINCDVLTKKGPILTEASVLQVLRRLRSIFTSVYAAIQILKKALGWSFNSAWLTISS